MSETLKHGHLCQKHKFMLRFNWGLQKQALSPQLMINIGYLLVYGLQVRPGTVNVGQSQAIRFSDNSAIVGCISRGDETKYRIVVDDFVTLCEQNYLQLNVTKTMNWLWT